MAKIQFRNKAHRDFVFENLEKCRHKDCYHQAFFYVMGIPVGLSRSATLPLIFGTVLRRREKKTFSHRMNYSVADMLPTLWRVSNSGIPNIVEI